MTSAVCPGHVTGYVVFRRRGGGETAPTSTTHEFWLDVPKGFENSIRIVATQFI